MELHSCCILAGNLAGIMVAAIGYGYIGVGSDKIESIGTRAESEIKTGIGIVFVDIRFGFGFGCRCRYPAPTFSFPLIIVLHKGQIPELLGHFGPGTAAPVLFVGVVDMIQMIRRLKGENWGGGQADKVPHRRVRRVRRVRRG